MQQHFMYQNQPVYVEVTGSGLPIVLVHGFAEDGNVWHLQAAFLQQWYQVFCIHLPGSGLSAEYNWSGKEEENTIEFFADVVHVLLKHYHINECIMLGHSMGGYITLAFAEKYPAYLAGFGLVHSTAFADSEEKKQNRKKGIDLIEQYGAAAFIKTTTPNLFSAVYKQQQHASIDMLIESGKSFKPLSLQIYYRAMMTRTDRTAVLKSANVPVLFVIGTEDIAVALADSLKQCYLPALSQINILEGVGHMGIWENPDSVNAALLQFLNTCYAAKRVAGYSL